MIRSLSTTLTLVVAFTFVFAASAAAQSESDALAHAMEILSTIPAVARKKTSTGSSKAMPKARKRREVRLKTSRIVQALCTKSLSNWVKKLNIKGKTIE